MGKVMSFRGTDAERLMPALREVEVNRMGKSIRGWTMPPPSGKVFHYFVNGASFCGNWRVSSNVELFRRSTKMKCCRACVQKYDAQFAKFKD